VYNENTSISLLVAFIFLPFSFFFLLFFLYFSLFLDTKNIIKIKIKKNHLVMFEFGYFFLLFFLYLVH